MNKDTGLFIAVILGVIALGAFFALSSKAPELAYRPIDVGGGSITVQDQEDVHQVVLDAELAAPGFITIHQSLSGAPATIVGTSEYLEAGVHEGLVIPVEEMLPGFQYIALLHADNGDQVYVTEDDLPVMVDGDVVRPDFIAIPEAERVIIPEGDAAEQVQEGE